MEHHLFVNISMAAFFGSLLGYVGYFVSKKNFIKLAAEIMFYCGSAMSAAALFMIAAVSSRVPMANTYETMILFAFTLPVIYIFVIKKDSGKQIAAGLSFLGLVLLAASSFLDAAPRPLVPALKSNWLTVHVVLSFVSYAAFAVAFVSAIIFLASKNKDAPTADDMTYRSILFGYPFLTLGIVTGAVWADQAWGSYWSWDPKETWALITWLIYGAYLHMRISMGIKGTQSAVMAVIGFILVLFTYFGVNYLLSGLHSYK